VAVKHTTNGLRMVATTAKADDTLRTAKVKSTIIPERFLPGPVTGTRPTIAEAQKIADYDYEGGMWF